MRLLDRYICREVTSHSLLGLTVFTFVFFVPNLVHLMDLVVRHSGGILIVSLLFLCTLPPVLIFTIPMSILVGVLIGLGRMSSDSEIVALNASGISLRRLLAPIGFIAVIGSLITLLITFWLSPLALRTLEGLEARVLSSQVQYAVQPRVFDERFPHFVLYVQDVEAAATEWRGVFLASSESTGGSLVTVAKDASVITGPQNNQIDLHLGAGSEHQYDPKYPDRYNVSTFGESEIPIDLSGATNVGKHAALTEAEQPTSALFREHGPNSLGATVELQNRLAFPAACLVFALLGVPVGVRPRRGGRAAGLILTLAMIGGYYFLWISGDHLAREGRIPVFAGIWAANIVAAIIGVLLFQRIERIREPNRFLARIDTYLLRLRRHRHSAPLPDSGMTRPRPTLVPKDNRGTPRLSTFAAPAESVTVAEGWLKAPVAARIPRRRTGSAVGFPMTIDIYLLKQFFYYFVGLLFAFVVIFETFTLFDLLGDIAKNQTPFWVVVNYLVYLAPSMFYQLTPLAVLVATLVTLAVLAKSNEVVAFKASGISLYRLILPLALAGVLLAGVTFVLDDTYLPYANQRQDALRNQIKGRPAQTYFQPARQWIFGENGKIYNYELFDPDHQLFGGLNVFELDPASFQLKRRVYAAKGSWEPSENTWVLTGGWIRDFDATGRVIRYSSFKVDSLPELTEPPSYFRREVRQYYQMNWRQLGSYIDGLRQAGFDTARLSVQLQKKFAFPLIGAIIVLLGAPFAFLVGTRGAIGGLAIAVGIGVIYWATAALFEAMGSIGQLPALLAAWSPDAIFGFLALYFFLRMPT